MWQNRHCFRAERTLRGGDAPEINPTKKVNVGELSKEVPQT